jgi:hypothetical protein
MLCAVGVELPHDVTVQRLHDADAREHCRPFQFHDQQKTFDCGLPLVELLVGLRKLRDVSASIALHRSPWPFTGLDLADCWIGRSRVVRPADRKFVWRSPRQAVWRRRFTRFTYWRWHLGSWVPRRLFRRRLRWIAGCRRLYLRRFDRRRRHFRYCCDRRVRMSHVAQRTAGLLVPAQLAALGLLVSRNCRRRGRCVAAASRRSGSTRSLGSIGAIAGPRSSAYCSTRQAVLASAGT